MVDPNIIINCYRGVPNVSPPLGGFTLASNAGSNSVLKFEDHPLKGGLNFGTIRYVNSNNKYITGYSFPNNNYIKGCISGIFGIILSHPIDSIKTHFQTSKNTKFTYTISNLYRGITSPLIGVGIEKAIVFGTYSYCRDNGLNTAVSGAISGLSAAVVVSPYERIKIMKQTNQRVSLTPSFLFRGLTATFTREVPGFAIYFSTYEWFKNHFYTSNNREITMASSFLFGGISGTTAWIFIYPQDRIKTVIQSNSSNSIRDIIKNTYNNGGLKQFYSGFSFAVCRAILLHSGTFCMMEYLNKQL
jgi:solute carrier family 25 carnitine/acylcarnitine transporter 20/29